MVAINLRELNYCHFLFDAPNDQIALNKKKSKTDTESKTSAFLYLIGGGTPLSLELDIDEQFDEEDESETEMGECRGVFYDLEHVCLNSGRIVLTDTDGETIFVRIGNLALLEAPLVVLEGYAED